MSRQRDKYLIKLFDKMMTHHGWVPIVISEMRSSQRTSLISVYQQYQHPNYPFVRLLAQKSSRCTHVELVIPNNPVSPIRMKSAVSIRKTKQLLKLMDQLPITN